MMEDNLQRYLVTIAKQTWLEEISFIFHQSSQSTVREKNQTNLKKPSLQPSSLATMESPYIPPPDSLQGNSSGLYSYEGSCFPCLVGLSWRWVWKDKVWIGYCSVCFPHLQLIFKIVSWDMMTHNCIFLEIFHSLFLSGS